MAEAAEADVLEVEVEDDAPAEAVEEQDNAPAWSPEEERIASSLGWSPKEKWRGSDGDWKTPAEFLSNTREVIFGTRDENKRLKGQITRIVGEVSKLQQAAKRQGDAADIRELQAAVEAGDLDGAREVLTRAKQARDDNQPPAVADFAERNSDWFNVDPEATAYAQALDAQYAKQAGGVPDPDAHMKRIEAGVKRRFPELFGEAKPDPKPEPERKAAPVLGRPAGRTPGRTGKGPLTTADMSQDMRRAARECGVSDADYIASFNAINGA